MLIERCRPGTRLWDSSADEPAVVALLLPRLWAEPDETHSFKPLADEADRWANVVSERYEKADAPFERIMLDYAVDVFRSVDRTAKSLVNQDLHGGNVLRAAREPWLVVDPKPLVGEREANGVAPLRNAAFNGGMALVRGWLDTLAELGLDRERLRGWGVAHVFAWGWSDDGGWSRRAAPLSRSTWWLSFANGAADSTAPRIGDAFVTLRPALSQNAGTTTRTRTCCDFAPRGGRSAGRCRCRGS